jgi:hypothetical protein
MRWGLLIAVLLFSAFYAQWGARSWYIHWFEFAPAQRQWEDAHARADAAEMLAAYGKLERAHARSRPLWFLPDPCDGAPAVVPYRDGMTLCPGQTATGHIIIVPIPVVRDHAI